MKIKIFNKDVKLPTKSHNTDAGYDLYLPQDITIKPFETICIELGIGFAVDVGYTGIFVPRSSMAKKGLIITPALYDPSYLGCAHLIMTNCSLNTFEFKKDDRVCSFVVFPVKNLQFEVVDEFDIKSSRGDNGLGSTGR